MIYFLLPTLSLSINFGIVNKSPISQCNSTTQTGLLPELIQLIIQSSNEDSSSIKYTCFSSYDSAASALQSHQIDITFLPMTFAYSNFSFTVPLINNGLVLLTKNHTKGLFFLIFEPFDYPLWVVLLFLPILIGHFFWFFERSPQGPIDLNYKTGIQSSIWRVYLSVFLLNREYLRKVPTRLMMISYWFIVFIISANYISLLSSKIVKFSREVNVSDYQSLSGKLIGTYPAFAGPLRSIGIAVKEYPDGDLAYTEITKDILLGNIDAGAVLFTEAWQMNSEYCEITLIGSVFFNSFLSFAYTQQTDQSFIYSFQASLQDMLDSLIVKRTVNKYLLLTAYNMCNSGLDLPLPIDLIIICLSFTCTILLIAVPIYCFCFKSFLKTKITDDELAASPSNKDDNKPIVDFMSMMIKFECVLSSSKSHFLKKSNELKETVQDFGAVSSRYEDLIKDLLFKIDSI